MRHTIGVIGLGIMGRRMLNNMSAHGGFSVVAAWDPDPTVCTMIRNTYPDIRIAGNADEVIGDARVRVVYIASPPAAHVEYALAVIERGKGVYCEKPLAVDLRQSEELVRRAEHAGVINTVNFSFAGKAASETISKALRDGKVGDASGVDIRLHFCRWPRDWQAGATWLAKREQGGFVREVLSHYVYLTERLFGRTNVHHASVRYPQDGVSAETQVLADLNCNGIAISVAGGIGGVGPDRVEYTVWGTQTSYRLYDWNRLQSSTGEGWIEELTDIENPRQEGYISMLNNFHALLEGKPHTMPSFRDGLSVQTAIEKILAS
jgi:1,5-anhydro-D-fructose reductase (1,5-anhydro-D-mannitol-forming)